MLSAFPPSSGIVTLCTRCCLALTGNTGSQAWLADIFTKMFSTYKGEHLMAAENNTTVASRWYEEVFNGGHLELIEELFAPNFVDHDPSNPLPGFEGLRQLVNTYRGAFPDIHLTVEDEITEGDKVVTRFTGRGTHKGPLMGIPPTGKRVTITAIDILR